LIKLRPSIRKASPAGSLCPPASAGGEQRCSAM
jgi:hypothetical protein